MTYKQLQEYEYLYWLIDGCYYEDEIEFALIKYW